MKNQYDELKDLISKSRSLLGKKDLNEIKESLISKKILKEEDDFKLFNSPESDENTDEETPKDLQKSYRVSGGVITLHGKDKKDIELSTDEKISFQETMDDFVNEVSDLSDFGVLNLYRNNVEWSGRVIDMDIEFYFSIGEESGVYINGNMIKLDENLTDLINKLNSFYEKFKSKWAKIMSQRKKTKSTSEN
jgi:hypothetical protein